MHKYNYRSRSQPGCDVIARSALILVHASPHEPIGTSYHELEKAGDELRSWAQDLCGSDDVFIM